MPTQRWPRQAVVEKKQTRLGRWGRGGTNRWLWQSQQRLSQRRWVLRASPSPAPGPRAMENSDQAAFRLPTALSFQCQQQKGSKRMTLNVHSRNVDPATAHEGPPPPGWRGRCLPTYKTTRSTRELYGASSVGRGCAFCCSAHLTNSTASKPLGFGVCPRRRAAPTERGG